jgi:hypothetical protein
MKDLPTIVVIGYAVDLSWVSLVKAALTETYNQPASPAESPVIRILGGVEGPEFVVTLKPRNRTSKEELFVVKPDPHGPEGVVLLVPEEPVDQMQGRTGWMRNHIYDNIVEWVKHPQPNTSDVKFEDEWQNIMVAIPIVRADSDFEIYFHPDLSRAQVDKSFAAIADFYRACGGTGFRVQLEDQDLPVAEVTYDGRR